MHQRQVIKKQKSPGNKLQCQILPLNKVAAKQGFDPQLVQRTFFLVVLRVAKTSRELIVTSWLIVLSVSLVIFGIPRCWKRSESSKHDQTFNEPDILGEQLNMPSSAIQITSRHRYFVFQRHLEWIFWNTRVRNVWHVTCLNLTVFEIFIFLFKFFGSW